MLCVCSSWSEYIRFSQLAICRSKHQTFTHEQRQIGSDCACACGMINGKKMLIKFVCAGLTLTLHAQVYLCLRCYHKFMRDKDEFKHPWIFGVCALLLILLRINKRKTLLSSSHFVFAPYFFFKIIIIIYANMHVTITWSRESTWQSNNKMADYCTWTLQLDVPGPILCNT